MFESMLSYAVIAFSGAPAPHVDGNDCGPWRQRAGEYAISSLVIRADFDQSTAVGQRAEWRLSVEVASDCETTVMARRVKVEGKRDDNPATFVARGAGLGDTLVAKSPAGASEPSLVLALDFHGDALEGFAFVPALSFDPDAREVVLAAEALVKGARGKRAPRLSDGRELSREARCRITHGLDRLGRSGDGFVLIAPEGNAFALCVEPSNPEGVEPRAPLAASDPFR